MGKFWHKKNHSIISVLLLVSVFASALIFPSKARAFWGVGDFGFSVDVPTEVSTGTTAAATTVGTASQITDTSLHIKDVAKQVLVEVAKAVARKALAEMTKSTVNWINSGFHGAPLFVENPQSFLKDIQKSEVKDLVDTFGYDITKFPFGRDFALNIINGYKSQLDSSAAYSLSKISQDENFLHNYQNDFNVGGWNGFLINTQYPQNNYPGFQMLATEELARRIAGTQQTAVQRVQTALSQGQGFLSPQTCPSNPDYNNGYNEFVRPSFDQADAMKNYNPPTCDGSTPDLTVVPGDPHGCPAAARYDISFQDTINLKKGEWAKTNTCPGGLVSTTPGSVVASQITKALGVSQDQASLGAAFGNSLSAIFDALLNHFLDKGLNSLASKVNPPPQNDNWSYGGLTLNTDQAGETNTTWDANPDQVITLDDFKKQLEGKTMVVATDASGVTTTKEEVGNTGHGEYVPGDIYNTATEVKLMSNDVPDTFGPGVEQMLGKIWPQARLLDICVPGPDLGWQDRVKDEVDRNSKKLQSLSSNGGSSGEIADQVTKELSYAVKFFQDWVNNRMMGELPNSILYIDAVNTVKSLSQQATELTDKLRVKRAALARMQAIDAGINTLTEPGPNATQAEQDLFNQGLITYWKQYQAALVDASNTISVENTRDELSTDRDLYNTLVKYTTECQAERKEKGWSGNGGPLTAYSGKNAPAATPTINNGPAGNTEQAIFCDTPISTGYTHAMFQGPGTAKPGLPMVNANKVLSYQVQTIKSSLLGGLTFNPKKTAYVNIQLSCNKIFNANVLDYKGDLPGITNVTDTNLNLPDDSGVGDLGNCTFPEDIGDQTINNSLMTEADCSANGGTWEQIVTTQPITPASQ